MKRRGFVYIHMSQTRQFLQIVIQDFALESFVDQPRQPTDMVQMSVGQQNSIDLGWVDGKLVPVAVLKLPFLIKPAIDKDLEPINLNEVSRTGNISGGA